MSRGAESVGLTSMACGRRGFLSITATLLATGLVRETALVRADEPTASLKYRLAYRFALNQQVDYEVEQSTEICNKGEGLEEIAGNSARSRRHFKVVSVEKDGAGDLEMTIDWAHMETSFKLNDNEVRKDVFKSDDPELQNSKFADVIASVGKPLARVRVNAAGRTLKVTPLTQSPATSNGSKLGETASPEGYLPLLPEEPVAVGDFWKERFDIRIIEDGLPIKIDLLRTHKLTKVENGLATIEFRTTILTPIDDPEKEMQLIQRETTGTVVFDLTQGMVITRESKVDKTVFNCFDGKGSMHAVTTYKERRITEDALVAKPVETEKK